MLFIISMVKDFGDRMKISRKEEERTIFSGIKEGGYPTVLNDRYSIVGSYRVFAGNPINVTKQSSVWEFTSRTDLCF